jgi:tetratricopeptide (TPR) repeat protein
LEGANRQIFRTKRKKTFLNWIYAANFFRDEGEYEKAESVYQGLFGFCQNNIGEVYRKTYNFTSLSYAQLLVLQGKPDEALLYLKPPLKQEPKNPLPYLYKALCLKAKGKYNEATDCFEKSVQFVRYNKEFFWYEYGCFVRNHLKDYERAKECFNKSLKQKENLPAYIELAEIELVYGNKKNAKQFLKRGLNLKPKNRKAREKYKELEDRINAIHNAVE